MYHHSVLVFESNQALLERVETDVLFQNLYEELCRDLNSVPGSMISLRDSALEGFKNDQPMLLFAGTPARSPIMALSSVRFDRLGSFYQLGDIWVPYKQRENEAYLTEALLRGTLTHLREMHSGCGYSSALYVQLPVAADDEGCERLRSVGFKQVNGGKFSWQAPIHDDTRQVISMNAFRDARAGRASN